jgi:hypothetical protein
MTKPVLLAPNATMLKRILKVLADGNYGINWQRPEGFKQEYGKSEMVILLPWGD